MARSRNIKPGFFKNPELAECEPLARLLFAALWGVADRDGRLEDRPKLLKIECLPYDDCDIDALLWKLTDSGFIRRYVADGANYIDIPTFDRHQNPHKDEKAKGLPKYTGQARCKPGASPVQPPVSHSSGPADSLNLTTDPLIPDKTPLPPLNGKPEPTTDVASGDAGAGKREKEKQPPVTIGDLSIPAPLDTPECRASIAEWLAYHRRIKKPYHDAPHVNGLLKNFSRDGPAVFIASVNHSIANTYQGLFRPKEHERNRTGSRNAASLGYVAGATSDLDG